MDAALTCIVIALVITFYLMPLLLIAGLCSAVNAYSRLIGKLRSLHWIT